MKTFLRLFGVIIGLPVLAVILLFMSTLTYFLVAYTAPPCAAPLAYHLTRMRWIAFRGEDGWDLDTQQAVHTMEQCRSKRQVALRLLEDPNEHFVAYGMEIVAREGFADGDRLLTRHFNDRRVNDASLMENGDYARLLLGVWKMKRE